MPSFDITFTYGRSESIVVATPWEVKLENGTIRFNRDTPFSHQAPVQNESIKWSRKAKSRFLTPKRESRALQHSTNRSKQDLQVALLSCEVFSCRVVPSVSSEAARNDACSIRSNFTVSPVPSERNSNALYIYRKQRVLHQRVCPPTPVRSQCSSIPLPESRRAQPQYPCPHPCPGADNTASRPRPP